MVYFINGGNSGAGTPYVGETVADATAALTLLRTEILGSGEGWVIGDVDDIGGSGQFSVDGTGTNNNKIRILFTRGTRATSGFADEYVAVRIRDLDASGTLTSAILSSYSPNDFHRIQISSSGSNLIYAAIYEDCINLMSIPSSGFATGIHAGMVDRVDPTDRTAMYIGYTVHRGFVSNSTDAISSTFINRTGWNYCYSALSPVDNTTEWFQISRYYADSGAQDLNEATSTGSIQWIGVDIVGFPTTYGNTTLFITSAADNPNLGAHLGRINSYQGKPILMPYLVIEGRSTTTNNQWSVSQETYCKGAIRDVVTGMGYMTAGAQWEDNNGQVYISTGDASWLAFRVA